MIKMNVKLCVKCNQVKPLDKCFYKAGGISFQKYCKRCHNTRRSDYNYN